MHWMHLTTAAALAGTQLAVAAPARRQAATCSNATFTPITAQAWVDGMSPGWNLGNTLDALPTEGSWNNPPVQFSTFDDVKAKGFKGVRLPVTWVNHFTTGSPTWDVDPVWMDRVEAVVDAILQRDLYAVVNVHHDATDWADVTAANANYTLIEEKFGRLWTQIAARLSCKSEKLSFEPINEPPASTVQHYQELTKLQNIYINAVTLSGGFNSKRVLNLVGPQESGLLTPGNFVRPENITNPWLIQYHYYSPYDFIFSAWGKTIWGSDADKQALESDIASVRNNFTDVPLIIGEYAASPANTETGARRKYNDFLVKTARKYNTGTVLWDNGADYLDRTADVWRDDTAIDIILTASAGQNNSLGDTTTDTSATTQQSSAYIFQQVGTTVVDQTLPFLFNGNTLKSIASSDGKAVTPTTDYTVSATGITFDAALITRLLRANATGVQANLTLIFSAGADYSVQVVRWDTPTLATTTSAASAVAAGSDLDIPVTYKGLNHLATVSARTLTGGYLVDDWTQYLGPLQNGRTTFSNQWSFNDNDVIITAAAVAAVQALNQTIVFTFEFYPRVPGNNATYTLTV